MSLQIWLETAAVVRHYLSLVEEWAMWKEEGVEDEGRVERAETEVDVWYLLVEVHFSVLEAVSLLLVRPLT